MAPLPTPGPLRHAGCPRTPLTARLTMRAAIALGSNLGDRLALLKTAARRIRTLHDGNGPFLSSPVYETAPVDCPEGSPPFLNAVVELSSSLPPFDLLNLTRTWERELGRRQDAPRNSPRPIDLDLLFVGTHQISHTSLTLPHPRISERLFVLQPLTDICPDHVLPGMSQPIHKICDVCKSQNKSETIMYSIFSL